MKEAYICTMHWTVVRTVTDEDHDRRIRAIEELGQAAQAMGDVTLGSARKLSELLRLLTLTPETEAGKITA